MAETRVWAGLLLTVIIASVACTSGVGAPAGEWSRGYLAAYDRVFASALDSLEEMDFYLVEIDERRGEIRADASVRRGREMTLLVRVEDRPSGVRVDVMAQSPNAEDHSAAKMMSAVVTEFLGNLDIRLEGRSD